MYLVLCLLFALDTTPIVKNDVTPKGKKKAFVFTEELSFGVEEDGDEYLWGDADTTLAVDANGHIYVADISTTNIFKFDENGKYVKTIASKGEGPGELASLATFHIFKDGTAMAHELLLMTATKLHFFNKDMSFNRSVTPEGDSRFLLGMTASPDGSMIGTRWTTFEMEKGKRFNHYGVLNKNLEKVIHLATQPQGMQMNRMLEPAYLVEYFAGALELAYGKQGVYNFGPDGRIYTAHTDKYEITVWDPTGTKKERIITRDYKPLPNRPAEIAASMERIVDPYRRFDRLNDLLRPALIERAIDEADVPDAKLPVHGIFVTDKNHLIVIHNIDDVGTQTFDVFDGKGAYIATGNLPEWAFVSSGNIPRMRFQNGKAYTIQTDEEGDNRAKRFSYSLR